METVHARMEDSVYSIHLLIIILVIVLVLDTRESTVLVSALSGLDMYHTSLNFLLLHVGLLCVLVCWALHAHASTVITRATCRHEASRPVCVCVCVCAFA